MANRQNTLLLKRSNVIGKIPPISGLTLGEMALNTADAKLYSLYTSGTTGATEVRQIGWDRISRTGDTVTGDFNIFGDVAISGSSLPSGYALTVTGDTDIVGDLYVEGDIDYDGNLIVSGSGIFQSGLTANTIYTDYIDFNTGATVPQSIGRISWDSGTGTLNVAVGDNNTGFIDLQVGQEEIVRVYNAEATTLLKGEIVYVSGSQGNRPKVKRAQATSDGYSVTTLGMVDRNIASGAEGYVTTFGIISNLNTLGLTGGTPIWLSGTVPGGYTSTKPIAPLHTVLIGYVIRVDNNVGSIFVNISNGWELDELHDVRISAATEGDLLMRSSYSGTPLWVNSKTLNGSYTITGNTNIGGNLTVSGTTFLKGLSATTISATTIGTSGDCIDDIYVSNIHSCSPLNINPLDEGNVYFGSTSGVTIDLTNNRVGVGTSLPQETLHISGKTRFDNDITLWDDGVNNGESRKIIFRGLGQTGNTQDSSKIYLDAYGGTNGERLQFDSPGIRFRITDADGFYEVSNLVTNNPAIASFQTGGLGFQAYSFTNGFTFNQGYNQTSGDLFKIWNDGLGAIPYKAFSILASNGNVGIGVNIPTAKLHINNTTSGNTFLVEDDTNPDSTPFVIDLSGNTGIGTLTPTQKLDVAGNIRLSIGSDRFVRIGSSTNYWYDLKTEGDNFKIFDGDGTTRFVLRYSVGSVGIGVTLPAAKLHVNNTTSGDSFLVEDSTNPDSTPFVIDASGNTGIGTLFPTAKLDVSGNTIISSGLTATTINVPPLADDKIVYTTNNGRLTTTSAFTYNQSNNTFSVNNIDANGNFNITGNTTQSGNTFQNGNLNITGNTNQIGNFTQIGNVTLSGNTFITGNTTQSGNTIQYGNIDLTGNTTQSGNTNQIGNIFLSGNTFITGNTTQIGNVILSGDTSITGNTNQIGNITLSGDTVITGNTNQVGNYHITGDTSQIGNSTMSGNTFITGNTTQIGNYHITGDTSQSGNTTQTGNVTLNGNTFITGNTNQIGNFTITGNTTQSGNTTQIGNFHITGNTSQLGDSTQTGNVTLSGDTFITGNTTQSGNTTQFGNTSQTGTTSQIGNFIITGNTTQSGSTTQVGNYNVTGNTNQLGYNYIVSATTGCTLAVTGTTCLTGPVNITGPTFMSGNFCMNNMNSTGQTGTNCLDTTLIQTGTTVVHQFQGESGVIAHIGDLASGEPNSRGFTYFENNTDLTSFVAVGQGNYTPVIGAPQTFTPYNNLFTVTTGATSATIHRLTYNYPSASGDSSATFLKFTASVSILLGQNQQLTFQVRRNRGGVLTFLPIGMSITPQTSTSPTPITFNGIADAQNNDIFQVVVKNDTGANPSNSIRISDMAFSMFT